MRVLQTCSAVLLPPTFDVWLRRAAGSWGARLHGMHPCVGWVLQLPQHHRPLAQMILQPLWLPLLVRHPLRHPSAGIPGNSRVDSGTGVPAPQALA